MAEANDKPSSLADAVHRLRDRKSTTRVYNSLVFIRTNFAKGSDAATKLRHLGGIENLIKILSELENIKCHDVALSILGNSCLDNKVRLQILKCGGIRTLCDVLRTATKESIRNRACRVITNLSENIACCDVIYDEHSDIVSVIVAGLAETTDKGCMTTYCRAIRMLSDTDEHRAVILDSGAVKPVAALLSSEDDSVVLAAMKTLSHFVNHCSEEGVRQLVAASVLTLLVPLTLSTTSEISTMSSSILLSVATSVPRLRPYLSGAGAMKFFIRQVRRSRESPLDSRGSYRAIDAICHCCRDANSRVKLRELGGLELLIELLTSDQFNLIHDRVISALVSFIYDDAGVEGLLQYGLIRALVRHLYRCASIPKHDDLIELDWLRASRVKTRFDTAQTSSDALAPSSDVPTIGSQALDAGAEGVCNAVPLEPGSEMSVDPLYVCCQLSIDVAIEGEEASTDRKIEENPAATDLEVETSAKEKDHPSYSIHSPTYKAVLQWQTNAYEGSADDVAPRNIYEGAFMFADSHLQSGSRSASSSPSRSPGSSSPYRRSNPVYSLHSSRSDPNFGCESQASTTSPWSSPAGSSSPTRFSLSGSPVYEAFSPFSTSSYPSPSQASSPSYTSANVDIELDFSSPAATSCGASPTGMDCAEGESISGFSVEHLGSECDLKVTTQCSGAALGSPLAGISNSPTRSPEMTTGSEENSRKPNRIFLKTEDSDVAGRNLSIRFEALRAAGHKDDPSGDPSGSSLCDFDTVPDVADAVETSVTPIVTQTIEIHCIDKVLPVLCKDGDNDDELGDSDGEDDLDIEAYQRNRDDQRRYDRLLDIANGMYADAQFPSGTPLSTSSTALFRKNKRRHCSPAQTAIGEPSTLSEPCQQRSKTRKLEDHAITPNSSQVFTSEQQPEDPVSAVGKPTQINSRVGSEAARQHSEKNILNLISRASHLPDPSAYLVEARLLCALLDYCVLARKPVATCTRILLRLSRDPNCFELAVLSLFPLLVNRRLDSSWRPVEVRRVEDTNAAEIPKAQVAPIDDEHQSASEARGGETLDSKKGIKWPEIKKEQVKKEEIEMANIKIKEEPIDTDLFEIESKELEIPVYKIKTEPMETKLFAIKMEEIESNQELTSNRLGVDVGRAPTPPKKLLTSSELRDEVLANMSVMAASGFGVGVLSHILLRGDSDQRELSAISLCYLCRSVALRKKFLADMKAVDLLMNLLKKPSGRLFSGTVLALCHLVDQLSAPSLLDVRGVETRSTAMEKNDFVFILDDGSSAEACRKTLANSSQVFAAMLSGSFKEAVESRIKLPEVSPFAIGLLINLTHGRPVGLDARDHLDAVLECFELSHRFQLPDSFNLSLYRCLVLGIIAVDRVDSFSAAFDVLNSCGFRDHCRDLVLRVFSADMDLAHHCSAVSEIVKGPDCMEFLSLLKTVLLDFMRK